MVVNGRLPRVARFLVLVALATQLSGCCWFNKSRCEQNLGYPDIALAVEKAARSIHGQYGACIPAAYDSATFLADLQKNQDLREEDVKALSSVDLDLWTDENCVGYVLVASHKTNHQIVLWDKSVTRSTLDGSSVNGQPPPPAPARTPPTTCACTDKSR
jgi:hypothetical protein